MRPVVDSTVLQYGPWHAFELKLGRLRVESTRVLAVGDILRTDILNRTAQGSKELERKYQLSLNKRALMASLAPLR